MIISNEYIKHNPLCLCACIVTYAREIYNLEKWPPILTQVFGVNFNSFENIYNEFHELIILTIVSCKNPINFKQSMSNIILCKLFIQFLVILGLNSISFPSLIFSSKISVLPIVSNLISAV